MQIHRLHLALGIRVSGEGAQETVLTGSPGLFRFENLCYREGWWEQREEGVRGSPSRGNSPEGRRCAGGGCARGFPGALSLLSTALSLELMCLVPLSTPPPTPVSLLCHENLSRPHLF